MERARLLAILAIVSIVAVARASDVVQPEDGELDADWAPGLIACYRSVVNPEVMLTRVDVKPAFALGHSTRHPRIPPGPFEVTWTGLLVVRDPGPIVFDACVCGELELVLDGAVVLQGRGETERARIGPGKPFDPSAGPHRLAIRYRSVAGLPARLQIGWRGAGFAREPLPPWQLKHRPRDLPPSAREELIIERGRELVGRFGCARCHRDHFPAAWDAPPGPSLADAGQRIGRQWLVEWLADPARLRPAARMPALFAPDRTGFAERWIVANYLVSSKKTEPPTAPDSPGDHRMGRRQFISLGCAACHFLPDLDRTEQPDFQRLPLIGLADRLPHAALVEFLLDPQARYPDRRMPCLPMSPETARDIAAYLLLWSQPTVSMTSSHTGWADAADKQKIALGDGTVRAKPVDRQATDRGAVGDGLGDGTERAKPVDPPTSEEMDAVSRRLGTQRLDDLAVALVREKRCADCHPGLDAMPETGLRLTVVDSSRGCLSGQSLPRFVIDEESRAAIVAYLAVAPQEKYASPFERRQQLARHLGCWRCHARDTDQPPPIEQVGSTLGGAWLQSIPFQRTPRLHFAHQKYMATYLRATVMSGIAVPRSPNYSYRMPAFGDDAGPVLEALAEADGDLVGVTEEPTSYTPSDPTLGPLVGPQLVGFQGYSCVSCHAWNGQMLADPDPGATGPDLTKLVGRIRRDWFDRYLENPLRFHPGTPMPAVFPHGRPATLRTVLDGDAARQRDALWEYFALGASAPSPKPAPPLPVPAPDPRDGVLVAQIPLHMPDQSPLESLCILTAEHDLVVYDIGAAAMRRVFVGGQILRAVRGRLRTYTADGIPFGDDWLMDSPLQRTSRRDADEAEKPEELLFEGYDRLADGVRIRWRVRFASDTLPMHQTIRIVRHGTSRQLVNGWYFQNLAADRAIELGCRTPGQTSMDESATVGAVEWKRAGDSVAIRLSPDSRGIAAVQIDMPLPAAQTPPQTPWTTLTGSDSLTGSPERPGYRAILYPRPKTESGEDVIMPIAVAADPEDGRVFVASTKLGEIFVLDDPNGDGRQARFVEYTGGLFQEVYSLLAERDALYVLHRRNLTRVTDSDGDGRADRFDRVFGLPHGIADSYDYAYGLVRDRSGAFVFTFAPHANQHLIGSGSALRWPVGAPAPQAIAFGFRNPLGWCAGPEGEIFFTDNQGEWVATNKLCHLVPGRYYGYPNSKQREHTTKPPGRSAIWVPYAWAHSINGVTYDNTGGKFGPFAGQVFMAELMFGGAIIRANLERVNGEYQGACFPFWGPSLLGPVTLTFDPAGHLWVGSITEPGWMAQPDRGALFRIEFTGVVPFEMQSIHVRPRGFRIQFTTAVAPDTAADPGSYQLEHFRYEYTGAYGSPELDRTAVPIERVKVSRDMRSVELTTAPLVANRVYMITAGGVRSPGGEPLVHPTGAYTLNEIPDRLASQERR